MRSVAIATVLLTLPLLPFGAANNFDECESLSAPTPCQEIDLPQSPPSQVGHGSKYYLYLAALRCPADDAGPDCEGRPNPETTLPGGGRFGLLYEETNKYPGLQRFRLVLPDNTVYPPDTMVLY